MLKFLDLFSTHSNLSQSSSDTFCFLPLGLSVPLHLCLCLFLSSTEVIMRRQLSATQAQSHLQSLTLCTLVLDFCLQNWDKISFDCLLLSLWLLLWSLSRLIHRLKPAPLFSCQIFISRNIFLSRKKKYIYGTTDSEISEHFVMMQIELSLVAPPFLGLRWLLLNWLMLVLLFYNFKNKMLLFSPLIFPFPLGFLFVFGVLFL